MTPEERRDQLRRRQLAARIRAAQESNEASEPETGFRDQTMSGVNEGLAIGLGFPVDAVTGAINGVTSGVNSFAGTEIPKIENPVLGSAMMQQMLDPVISDAEPQNVAQRFGRRIGQEVGQTVPMAMGVAGAPGRVGQMARSNLPRFAGTEAAGTAGAGAAAATAQEFAPDNPLIELAAQFAGGAAGAGAVQGLTPGPRAPSMDDLRGQQKDAYRRVDRSNSRLTPDATDELRSSVTARSARDSMDPILAPKASRTAQRISELDTPTIAEVEKMRRLSGRVAGNVDPTESELGMGMKEELTRHLDDLDASKVSGGDPEDAISALRTGRDTTRRIKASEAFTGAVKKGERRAATSGTGGNEVNAIRQNIRSILDSPKKRRGFTAEELAGMEDIVNGSPTQNALRMIGRFSPTSGFLPASLGVGSSAALGPLGAIPSAIGAGAKGLSEMSTSRSISALDELIRNGGPVAPKTISDAQKSALATLFAAQLSGASTNQ